MQWTGSSALGKTGKLSQLNQGLRIEFLHLSRKRGWSLMESGDCQLCYDCVAERDLQRQISPEL